MGKVTHWELCKKFEFDYTNKWYMHNPESILENETHKLLWNFEIQTDHLILARWPDLIIINKKKKKKKKKELAELWTFLSQLTKEYLDLAKELKKLWNMKVIVIPIVISALGTVSEGLVKGLKDLEIRGREETIQTTALLWLARILKRDLKRLVVIQTPPVKDY